MKLWKDMTPEEKGALLLAYHEGKVIEYKWENSKIIYSVFKEAVVSHMGWHDTCAYRVKHEPVVREVVMYGKMGEAVNGSNCFWNGYEKQDVDTHKITFNVVDGVPDCKSIKMVALSDQSK